ncbi:glycosyltransferase [Candidatus Azambacteria bacterium]|nr:glycosyltransferase [Candidatus Azambacteria bacterium]MBI3685616.1 glycosyltransferase [Candidatus Azambacteria bacterium]
MTICYFGDFDREYSRNRVIIKGLRENGVEVLLCNERLSGWRLWRALARKHKALRGKYDVMIVGYSDSRFIVPLAKLLSKKPIVWDAFYSLYDSFIFDRKLASSLSLKVAYYWFFDWFSCVLADKVLLDTNAHIEYFVKTFGVSRSKCVRVLVGTDDKIFYPRESRERPHAFTVHFHGKFIPLQGVEYILKAASLLKNEQIAFRMVGKGQEYRRARKLADEYALNNVEWIDRVSYHELADLIVQTDIVLGIFGNTPKARRVIPNKVYEGIAMGKAVISADTPAVRELFQDKENILLCAVADGDDLARKIAELREDVSLRERIAKGGRALFMRNASPNVIGKALFEHMVGLEKEKG